MLLLFSVAKSCPTLCDAMDCSLPSSSVHRSLQARILEWVNCHFLLQGIFLDPVSNPCLLFSRKFLYSWASIFKGIHVLINLGVHVAQPPWVHPQFQHQCLQVSPTLLKEGVIWGKFPSVSGLPQTHLQYI